MIGFLSETVQTVKQAKKKDVFTFFLCFVVAIAFIGLSFFLIDIASKSDRLGHLTDTDPIVHLAETLRNAAWVLWVGLTIASLIVGFRILNRGQEQKKAGIDHEVYKNNLDMLASNSTMLRVAGIRWLQKLIKDDFNAGQMFFEPFMNYIQNPYMHGEEHDLDNKFPVDKPLPSDIQGVADGLSMIAKLFYDNEAIKAGLEFPKTLWEKTNFFQNLAAGENKFNNRKLTIRAIKKGIKGAKSVYYQGKLSNVNLANLWSFLKNFTLTNKIITLKIITLTEKKFKEDKIRQDEQEIPISEIFETVLISDYTWQKEKDNFYKDVQEMIKKVVEYPLIRKTNVEYLSNKIAGALIHYCEKLKKENEKDTNLEITLPPYFWKNEKKDPVNFPSACLQKNDMKEACLVRANLAEAILENVNLSKASLEGANLNKAKLNGANLSKASLEGANLNMAKLNDANLSDANLFLANFFDAELMDAKLIRADLQGACLVFANISQADFTKANLEKSYFNDFFFKEAEPALDDVSAFQEHFKKASKANFALANLYAAEMIQMGNYLQGCNFASANLEEAKFCIPDDYAGGTYKDDDGNECLLYLPTNLEGVEFGGANLSGAVMNLVEGLSKEQILSAQWGINREGEGKPPILSDEFRKDKKIKKWLEKPHYDFSKLSEEEWKHLCSLTVKIKEINVDVMQSVGGKKWPTFMDMNLKAL